MNGGSPPTGKIVALICVAVVLVVLAIGGLVTNTVEQQAACGGGGGADDPSNRDDPRIAQPLVLRPGDRVNVAATTYGGENGSITGYPGQENLDAHPDTYAELSTLATNPYPNFTFNDADALGRLPYMTPLRVSRNGKSMVLYKRDIGFGQGGNALDGHPARLDIYQPSAEKLGVSYSMVQISLTPRAGAGNTLGVTPAAASDAHQQARPVDPDQPRGGAQAAAAYALKRNGRVAFAIAKTDGTLVASYRAGDHFGGSALMQGVLVVALARTSAGGRISRGDSVLVTKMIDDGDSAAAGRLYDHVGASAVAAVVRAAGLKTFTPPALGSEDVLGAARTTAADQARFVARLELLIPAERRGWVRGLLSGEQTGAWGLLASGLPASTYAVADRSRGANGRWTIAQGARFSTGATASGVAVLTDSSPGDAYGRATIGGVSRALLTGTGGSGPGSSLSDCQGSGDGGPLPLTAGSRAKILPDGRAAAPAGAPEAIKQIIAAANEIISKPYVYGGGHGTPLSRISPSYDCSSSVTHALYGAKLLGPNPQTSGELMSFGDPGPGQWVTIKANEEHVFMYVAGIRFDTSYGYGGGNQPPGSGPRWRSITRPSDGFATRHPKGL